MSTNTERVAHTPGPWVLEGSETEGWFQIATAPEDARDRVVLVSRSGWNHRAAESMANGRLMTVAPELFAAMKVLLEGFEQGVFVRNIEKDTSALWPLKLLPFISALAKGQQAIAKAEGP